MSKINKTSGVQLSRRSFMVSLAATGVVCATGIGSAEALAATSYNPATWYSIGSDGIVTVNVAKADMGQHVASTMAQIIADELGAAWSQMRVTLVGLDAKMLDPVLGLNITGGSWSTMWNFEAMSKAGAAGRMALAEAGAGILGAKPEDVSVANGAVTDKKSGKSVSFGDIVKSGKATKVFTAEELKAVKLKTADQYTLIGKDVPQIDIPFKVNGTAKYGIDTVLPGMLYGRIITPPVRYGAKVTKVDDAAAKKMPGFVQAVTVDDPTGSTTGWVVVVAKTYWEAIKAADAVKVTYDNGPNANASSESLMAESKRLVSNPGGEIYFMNGDPAPALQGAAKVLEAEFTTSHNIHAPLEPQNCTAEIKDGKLHLYSGNQFWSRAAAIGAGAIGMKPEDTVTHQFWIGGGFGRRLDTDMVVPAAVAAKATGKPVKVIYSREHDMQMDFTRPQTLQTIQAGLDANGKIVGFAHDVSSAWVLNRWGAKGFMTDSADGHKQAIDGFAVHGSDFFYSVPNHKVRALLNEKMQAATPAGYLRSVAPGYTFWAVESMMDMLAHSAKKDPAEFRLAMLDGAGDNAGAQRLANALRTVMGMSGYGTKVLPKGEAYGVACVSSQDRSVASWTACVAHVAVNAKGEVKVKKLTVATDVGTAVNPDGIRAQCMGGAQWGLSMALLEKATIKDGAIEQHNFDTYTPARMKDQPEIEVAIIANGEAARGVGEPTVTVIAPAIGNAIFNAVGSRVYNLPITPEQVKAGMSA